MTKIGLYDLVKFTTLESKKSHILYGPVVVGAGVQELWPVPHSRG